MANANIVHAASTENVPLTGTGSLAVGYVLDSVTIQDNDFVLLKDQIVASENGYYKVTVAVPNSRFFAWAEYPGSLYSVEEGAVNVDTFWTCVTNPKSTGSFSTDPVYFAQLASTIKGDGVVPPNLPQDGHIDARAAIQEFHDLSIGYAHPNFYPQDNLELILRTGTYVVTAADTNKLIRCMPALGATVNVQLTTILYGAATSSFNVTVASVGAGTTSITAGTGVTINGSAALVRYQAANIVRAAATNKFTQTPSPAVNGKTIYLPAGYYMIGAPGLIWHPAMSLTGSCIASTILQLIDNLPASPATAALISVVARSQQGGDSKTSWQAEFRFIIGFGGSQVQVIQGCAIEDGGSDPDFVDGKSYDGASARFIGCGFYNFSGSGVISQGNRQRFFAQHRAACNQLPQGPRHHRPWHCQEPQLDA